MYCTVLWNDVSGTAGWLNFVQGLIQGKALALLVCGESPSQTPLLFSTYQVHTLHGVYIVHVVHVFREQG